MKTVFKSFSELTPYEVYSILKLRSQVFVVEQNCVYLDLDDVDQGSDHCFGYLGDELVAYLRIVPPGVKYKEASIGRVVTAASARKGGYGRAIMEYGILKSTEKHGRAIRISAQAYLEKFYQSLGFKTQSSAYLEDGIPHIEMLLDLR